MMRLSVITCAYGSTSFLPETLAMFAAQDYAGEHELILLNSFPLQKLSCDVPNVKILNLDARPKSLGDCRNEAIKAATGDILLQLDVDDYILPFHLSTVAKHFKSGLEWIWFSNQWYSEKGQIKKLMPGNISSLAYKKSAWEKVGGFDPLTVGEDKTFIGKMTAQCKGEIVNIAPKEIGFIYGWNNSAPHISGLGPDEKRTPSSHVWAEQELARRVKSGSEPTGEIAINPKLSVDWLSQAKTFVKENIVNLSDLKNEVCIVLLGGIGEIVNCLPIARHIHDNFKTPYWMVSAEFESIFDGVSYVKKLPIKLHYRELDKALEVARKEFRFVLCAQVIGKNHAQVQNCSSYNIESWRNLGFESKFEDRAWMPLFDTLPEPKPKLIDYPPNPILARFAGVNSGSYDVIADAFPKKMLIVSNAWMNDISWLMRELNDASAIVTSDPDLIHLAAASNIPVVCITQAHPWLSVAPRCNVVSRLTREQVSAHPEDLILAVKAAVASSFPTLKVSPPVTAPNRRIFHAYDFRNTTQLKDRERIVRAQDSWKSLYDQGVIPCPYRDKKRTADKEIGDSRALPYLKDVLENAMKQADNDSIIFWSNDDVWLHPTLPDLLRFQVSVYGAVTSSRREFMRGFPDNLAEKTPEQIAGLGVAHIGRDLFAATKEWLLANWEEIPDAVIACSNFDLQLGLLCRIDKGIRYDQGTLANTVWPADLPDGYVCHDHHVPVWAVGDYPSTSPAQLLNKRLYDEFCKKHEGDLKP